MKFLKYLLGFILLLLVIFFGKGLMTPFVSYESEVVVNKPANEAWAVMSDESTMSQWISGFVKTEIVSGEPNVVGTVSNVYVNDGGQEMTMKETIMKVVPNEVLGMQFSMDFMDMDYEITFDEKDGKTTIKSKSKTVGNGLFAKSMVSFMPGAMKAQEDANLNNLKKLIDENTKNYFPAPVVEEVSEEQ